MSTAGSPIQSSKAFAIATAALYGSISASMNFINKATVGLLPQSSVLLLLQMTFTVVGAAFAWICGLFPVQGLLQMLREHPHRIRHLGPIVFLYNLNVGLALASLSSLNIPAYNVMKRLTPCAVILLQVTVLRKPVPNRAVLASVAITVAGSLVTGWENPVSDTAQETPAQHFKESHELLVVHATLSIPVLLPLVLLFGEAQRSAPFLTAVMSEASNIFLLISCMGMGSLLNFSLFLCTMTNSALTTTIVGILKSVAGTIIGFFVFGGVKVTATFLIGVSLNTVGGVWYSWMKFTEKTREIQQRDGAKSKPNGNGVEIDSYKLESAGSENLSPRAHDLGHRNTLRQNALHVSGCYVDSSATLLRSQRRE